MAIIIEAIKVKATFTKVVAMVITTVTTVQEDISPPIRSTMVVAGTVASLF